MRVIDVASGRDVEGGGQLIGQSAPAERTRLGAVILAAGASRRLGRPKQLLRRGTETLLARAARLARNAVDGRIVIVLGAEQMRLRSALKRRGCSADIVYNADWSTGMAGSLRAGLERIAPLAPGALVLLVDQPQVGIGDLGRLVRRWRRRPTMPVAAAYAGRLGVPVILPRRLFRAARALEGDVGARRLLRGFGGCAEVAMPSAGFDVDTPADADALADRKRLPGA